MRRVILAVGLAVLSGCGVAARTAENPGPVLGSPLTHLHHAEVGDVVTLSGADDAGRAGRLRLAVKVGRVVRTAVGHGPFEKPRRGERFVAVRFTLENVGTALYDDSPTYGAKVVDATGRTYDPTVATVAAGPGFAKVVRLRHGQSQSGYLVFAVPKKARIVAVRYALNAGLAPDRAEWRLTVPNAGAVSGGRRGRRR